uniref:Uncharacterized protein n=1 Tax=Oryza punctata TaxID=4537 RepID=A0A0E0KFN6_ORYPU
MYAKEIGRKLEKERVRVVL